MSRLRIVLPTTAEVAVTTSLKTVAQMVAPSNHRVAVRGWSISFDGVSSTAGAVEVQLAIQSSSGTFTASTLAKLIRGTTETIQSTGGFNCSAEPSITEILDSLNVSPQTGYERAFAPDEEIELFGNARFGIMVRASSGVNCHAKIFAEE